MNYFSFFNVRICVVTSLTFFSFSILGNPTVIDTHLPTCVENSHLSLSGLVHDKMGIGIGGVQISLYDQLLATTDEYGNYNISKINKSDIEKLSLSLDDSFSTGVNTKDLVQLSRHLSGHKLITNKYSKMAADVNNDDKIDQRDLDLIRNHILGIDLVSDYHCWKFVGSPEYDPSSTSSNEINIDFVGIKLGDVNGDALNTVQLNEKLLSFQLLDIADYKEVNIKATTDIDVHGLQTSFKYNSDHLLFENLSAAGISVKDKNYNAHINGEIAISWYSDSKSVKIKKDQVIWRMLFKKKSNNEWSYDLDFDDFELSALESEIYIQESTHPLALSEEKSTLEGLNVQAKSPKKEQDLAIVAFELPKKSMVAIELFDENNNTIFNRTKIFDKGPHAWPITRKSTKHVSPEYGKITYDGESVSFKLD